MPVPDPSLREKMPPYVLDHSVNLSHMLEDIFIVFVDAGGPYEGVCYLTLSMNPWWVSDEDCQ